MQSFTLFKLQSHSTNKIDPRREFYLSSSTILGPYYYYYYFVQFLLDALATLVIHRFETIEEHFVNNSTNDRIKTSTSFFHFQEYYLCFLLRSRIGHTVERNRTQSSSCRNQIYMKLIKRNTKRRKLDLKMIAFRWNTTLSHLNGRYPPPGSKKCVLLHFPRRRKVSRSLSLLLFIKFFCARLFVLSRERESGSIQKKKR